MIRIETKFILNNWQFEIFRQRCQMMFKRDQNLLPEINQYPIFSAYFDTPALDAYHQKKDGEFSHHKIRIRSYSNKLISNLDSFIEAKLKSKDRQNKIRIPLKFNINLLQPKYWYTIQDPRIFQILYNNEGLQHVANIYYEREAYECDYMEKGKIRVNFDSNICSLPKNILVVTQSTIDTYRLMPENLIVCEIKTPGNNIPKFIQKELKLIRAEQVRISKYAETIDALYENYRDNSIVY
ncbi:MAG: VTC domain-containing protein [Bdellovibrionota bacterium]